MLTVFRRLFFDIWLGFLYTETYLQKKFQRTEEKSQKKNKLIRPN